MLKNNCNITGYQKQEARQQVDKVCLCIAGFLQPQPFIQLYPALMESNDGFLDRFLICSPRPKLLLEEVEEWCTELFRQPLKSLLAIYQLITRWHHSSLPHIYTFSPSKGAVLAVCQWDDGINELTVWGKWRSVRWLFKGQKNSDQVCHPINKI